MKSIRQLACLLLLSSVVTSRADFLLQPNDVLAICGDSITQQKIYSVYIEDYLYMCQPVDGLRVDQFGKNAEKISGFLTRIKSGVLPFKPTVVTTCYGMNDGNYQVMAPATATNYQVPTQQVINQLKVAGVRKIIIGSPGCVDPAAFTNPFAPNSKISAEDYNETLDALRGIAQEVAQKNGLDFADIHTPMMEVMKQAKTAYGDSFVFIEKGNGIHPGPAGHLVMADVFLKALGCDGAIGTITVDLAAKQATATPGQKVISYDNGTVTLESTRYPFCFQSDPVNPQHAATSVLNFIPFNQELNRYMLVVKGIAGTKAKVTWGNTSKEFSAADLEKGINLAAEFLDNPFCDQFFKVSAAVQAQQAFETVLVQYYMGPADYFKQRSPTEAGYIDNVLAAGMKHEDDLFEAVKPLVIPVRHTIQITPEP
jgi:lysophospholipase L1-like esterase